MIHKKTYSITHQIAIAFIIGILVIAIGVFVFAFYTIYASRVQINQSAEAAMNLYASDLERVMNDMVDFNTQVYSYNYDFALLARDKQTPGQMIVSMDNLRGLMMGHVPVNGALMVFNQAGTLSLYQHGTGYEGTVFLSNSAAFHRIMDYCRELKQEQLYRWVVYKDQDKRLFLINAYRKQNTYVLAALDLSTSLMRNRTQEIEGKSYIPVYFDKRNIYITKEDIGQAKVTKEMLLQAVAGRKKTGVVTKQLQTESIIQARQIQDTPLYFGLVLPSAFFSSYGKVSLLIFFAVMILLVSMFMLIFRIFNKTLLYPLRQISVFSKQMEQVTSEEMLAKAETYTRAEELIQINAALENLVNQKISLTMEKEKSQKEEVKAQLQYYQLQTRSHFILNCLKSLYGMLETKQYARMQRMIIAFSNHIRYIFRDSSTLVPLQAELDEVTDYYNIVVLDSANPILLIQEVAPDTLNIQVPPLIIQTFVENAMKHNRMDSKPLQMVLQVETAEMEGNQYLKIRISDNGAGYDDQTLEQLNQQASPTYEQYHVGISNLKRRIQLIYKEDYTISFFNSLQGGACTLIYLPNREKENA